MTLHVLNSGMVGAPALSGTNGTLCAVLDWALNTIAGWQIEYTATNARIYRPQYGNRFRLYVNHDSAVSGDARLAVVRGCEDASAASNAGLIDPFPTPAVLADSQSNWIVSSTANATARAYWIFIDDGSTSGVAWIMFRANITGNLGIWDRGRWGDFAKRFSADNYSCEVEVRSNNSATSVTTWSQYTSNSTTASSGVYFARSLDGTVKSTRGALLQYAPGGFGSWTNAPGFGSGYLGKLDRTEVPLSDTGGNASNVFTDKGVMCRGWIPNLWNPVIPNATSVTALDTIQDGSYDPAANFMILTQGPGTGNVGSELIETTPTWRRI